MPKINVYLPDDLAAAVKEANVPVSAVCQAALSGQSERSPRSGKPSRRGEPTRRSGHQRESHSRGTRTAPPGRGARAPGRGRLRPHVRRHRAPPDRHPRRRRQPGDPRARVARGGARRRSLGAACLRQGGQPAGDPSESSTPLTPNTRTALELTANESVKLGHNYIGCEHLLLGLIAGVRGSRRFGAPPARGRAAVTRRAVATALTGYVHAQQRARGRDEPTRGDLERLEAIESRLAS